MKFAVLGDIHGNLEALITAYRVADDAKAEKIFHLGDLGGYAPSVNEVVDFLVEHDVPGVQGNYDDAVGRDLEHCGCKYETQEQAEMADRSFRWTKENSTGKSKAYMRSLPKEITLEVEGNRVKIFHAAPHKNNLYWYEDRPDKFFREMAEKADADVIIYGHTHKPYRKDLDGKVFINAGSVGRPKDGDPRTCTTIIEITPAGVMVDFLRTVYDVEKVAAAIVGSGLPPYFAERLKTAQ